MARKKWLLSLTVFVAVAQQIHAACVCNEKGEEACACSGVVRPLPKHPKRPYFQLPPVGDNCRCSKTLIEPASLPKPCSKLQNNPPKCINPRISHKTSYAVPQVNYVQQTLVKDNSPPADPISISLAAQAGKAIEVPEAKLSYGFVRKPINGLPRVYISSIKEEDLYALANDVITLKKPTVSRVKNIEDDYPEPEEEDHAPEDYEPPSLTYKQLGYEAEQYANPEFVPLPSYNAEAGKSLVEYSYKPKVDCGFKPDRIAKMKHVHKTNPIDYLLKY